MNSKKHPSFGSWWGMVQRCHYPKAVSYHNYGARGIRVCDRWRKFANFIEDMGEKPSSRHQIDRLDSDGDYTPENCRWVTRSENCLNRRTKHLVTLNGVTKNISEWIKDSGLKSTTVHQRIHAYGWTAEQALTKKVG